MTKLTLLLLSLMVALTATACTAEVGQDTVVPTAADSAIAAATQPASPAAPQETAVAAQQDPMTPEVQATEPLPTQAPAPTDTPEAAVLPVIGPAPGWDNDVWINSEGPLPLEELRGKVVLLEFWTFG